MIEKIKRRLFKTRYEVQALRRDVGFLTDMLKAHFDIKYTLSDFTEWYDRHPKAEYISTTEGEWLHYGDMLSRAGSPPTKMLPNQGFSFRDKKVMPTRRYTKEV